MQNYLTPNFSFAPMIPERALGSRVWGTEEREYIDLSGGTAVNVLERCHSDLVTASAERAHKLWHISNIHTTQPARGLAKKLVENIFVNKVFFRNPGAEANEAALKLARKYGRDHFGEHKTEIISCLNSFHGHTLFTVSADSRPKYSRDYASLSSDITHVPSNDTAALKAAVGDKTCAVVIEPIQGESGILPATQKYLQAARHLYDERGALLVLNEVQTGVGHAGKLFAYEHYGITPDIISSAKTLGHGFPIDAVLTTDKIAPTFGPGTHGSTFGGNPTACTVGNHAFDIIDAPKASTHAGQQGQELQTALREIGIKTGVFKEVRDMDLLLGCVLTGKYAGKASEITAAALGHDLMVLAAGTNVVRFAPSLLLNDEGLARGLKHFEAALSKWLA